MQLIILKGDFYATLDSAAGIKCPLHPLDRKFDPDSEIKKATIGEAKMSHSRFLGDVCFRRREDPSVRPRN